MIPNEYIAKPSKRVSEAACGYEPARRICDSNIAGGMPHAITLKCVYVPEA